MTTDIQTFPEINSRLSLQPLIVVLRKMITEGRPGARKLYQNIIDEVEAIPELQTPTQDIQALARHELLVETLLTTIFPPSTASNEGMYAVSFPFHSEVVYASPGFKNLFLKDNSTSIQAPEHQTTNGTPQANLSLAYNLILRKFYSLRVPLTASSVQTVIDGESGLTKYYELNLNAQFVDVKVIKEGFTPPADFSPNRSIDLQELASIFPLENFQFEGLMVINVSDVTTEQVITEIKNALININAFSDIEVYDELQGHVQSLLGLKTVQIGITPFFEKNGYYLYTEAHYKNSLLFKNEAVIADKDRISEQCREVFRQANGAVLYEELSEGRRSYNELLKYYAAQGIQNLILCPLKCEDGELIGLLEIASNTKNRLQYTHITRIQPVIPLFTLALEKTAESLQVQIDKTIKEHFTAIQPAVEWKFTEAAFQYLQEGDMARMPSISFSDVYPLYGSIDVRNSSLERSQSIQEDLQEQLNKAREVLAKADKVMEFPLLKEMQFRIDKYINAVSDTLLSDDEMMIYDFLQKDIDSIFKNIQASKPELGTIINQYFSAVDPTRKVIYHKRKAYEDSITRINDVLDRFMDQEQQAAQEAYPHYFERYITDGIEFNIYVGQAISPHIPFNEMYVRNLKLWQLTMLAKAARITNALEKRLSLPLQTTQLILAQSFPLNISFRRKERKFDVDGAYNIRYEIVKKRIDKVHLKDSDERLTQPGKIGIVYSQHKELTEYLEYIEFLQKEGLLDEEVEHLELEDTQGISGLKAIRVNVLLNNESPAKPAYAKGAKELVKR